MPVIFPSIRENFPVKSYTRQKMKPSPHRHGRQHRITCLFIEDVGNNYSVSIKTEASDVKERFPDLIHLIHSIQRIEGNPDCFGTAKAFCDQKNCIWRDYCLKKPEKPTAAMAPPRKENADCKHLESSQK